MLWKGGDTVCRLLNGLKQFGMYISSGVIVVSSKFLKFFASIQTQGIRWQCPSSFLRPSKFCWAKKNVF